MKYHYSGRCFAHRVRRRRQPLVFAGKGVMGNHSSVAFPFSDVSLRVMCGRETLARWGVWLGRHICYNPTQVS